MGIVTLSPRTSEWDTAACTDKNWCLPAAQINTQHTMCNYKTYRLSNAALELVQAFSREHGLQNDWTYFRGPPVVEKDISGGMTWYLDLDGLVKSLDVFWSCTRLVSIQAQQCEQYDGYITSMCLYVVTLRVRDTRHDPAWMRPAMTELRRALSELARLAECHIGHSDHVEKRRELRDCKRHARRDARRTASEAADHRWR